MSTSSEHECPFHGPGCVADPREGQDFDWREPVLCNLPNLLGGRLCPVVLGASETT